MTDYIERQAALDALGELPLVWTEDDYYSLGARNQYDGDRLAIETIPSADVEPVVRCKDCVHQTKFWHNDGRMKNGGYYIFGCDLADGYSHVCLDDDFCSCGERMDGEADDE